jgi:hypothetical protein
MKMLAKLPLLLSLFACAGLAYIANDVKTPREPVKIIDDSEWPMKVQRKSKAVCGESSETAVRMRVDNFLSDDEIDWLKELVYRGIAPVEDDEGPTIIDPDLALVLSPGAKVQKITGAFTEAELTRYGTMLKRVYDKIVEIHGLERGVLYHTAPTFMARITPFPPGKGATHAHDECKYGF